MTASSPNRHAERSEASPGEADPRQRPNSPPPAQPASLSLTLPLPPSVNNQYVTVGRRRVLSKPAQAFNRDVAKLVARARLDDLITPAMETDFRESLLGVYLTFYFETPHRRDLDGGLKIALDALCRALSLDDRAVVDLHLTKRIDPLHPHLDLELEAIPTWTFDRSYVYLGPPTTVIPSRSEESLSDSSHPATEQPTAEP